MQNAVKPSNLSTQLEVEVLNILLRCQASTDVDQIGKTHITALHINLNSDKPVIRRPYRLAIKEKEIMRSKIQALLETGFIRSSHSPYASPALLIKKKNNDFRLCVDYRDLNKIIIKNKYPLPIISDLIDQLRGFEFFSLLDLKASYYQIPISESSIPKTAFVTAEGQFEFTRMPFGLCNAPAVFMAFISQILEKFIKRNEAIIYLDDILIPSTTVGNGISTLEKVLETLQFHGLTLNLEKCLFLQTTIKFLGYTFSKNTLAPDETKIQAVLNFPQPVNQHKLRQFLGLTGFFRKFINNYARKTNILTKLLRKDARWGCGRESTMTDF